MIQAILILLVGLLTAVYLYFSYTYKYWLKKGILQETPIFLFGNFLDVCLNKKNAGLLFAELYNKYKNHDAVGIYEFQTPKLLVINPDLFEKILIKDFSSFSDNGIKVSLKVDPFMANNSFVMGGDRWKPARNSIVNGLTKTKLKDMYELMKQTVPHLKTYIDNNLDHDIEALELARLFMMTNVSNTVFGIESNCFADSDSMFHKMVQLFSEEWQSRWKVMIIFHLQRLRDLLGVHYIPKKVITFVESMVKQVVDVRLKHDIKRNDFLNYYVNLNKPLEEKITQIICNGVTFFIGGFDTSSIPSGNLIRELALNPVIQEHLFQELADAYEGKSELDYDSLMNLPLLDRSFKEILRKYPVLLESSKVCTKTTTIEVDGRTIEISKGTPVVIPVYAVQHDPQYYSNPDVFDPERFTEEAIKARHPYTWLPFGAGPRICAGMNFGLLQAKLFLATVVYYYRIELTDRTPSGLTLKTSSFFLLPEEDQWIRLIKRK